MEFEDFAVTGEHPIRLQDYDPAFTGSLANKRQALLRLEKAVEQLRKYQEILWAQNSYGILLVLQGMDTAGKDGVIKHVLSGIKPTAFQTTNFRAPSDEELDHDFLWRAARALPERGRIGVFNRSHYEEVLVVRVHPELLLRQRLPRECSGENIWKQRFEDIRNWEQYLTRNGIVVLKFFLNISRAEQKRRFLRRIKRPEKHWKFSLGDIRERAHWEEYMRAYEDAINNTATAHAPWHVIPADKKWFARTAIAEIVASRLKQLDLHYPILGELQMRDMLAAKQALKSEKK